MTEMLVILAVLWLIRAVMLVIRMALFKSSTSSSYNGFRIHVPESMKDALSPRELDAVYAHEQGHRRYLHPWRNYFRRVFFIEVPETRLYKQEREADDYAAKYGHALCMAAALRKRGGRRDDFDRADRLEEYGVAELKALRA